MGSVCDHKLQQRQRVKTQTSIFLWVYKGHVCDVAAIIKYLAKASLVSDKILIVYIFKLVLAYYYNDL